MKRILVVDDKGQISRFNQKFIEMWKIPPEIISSHDDNQAIAFVLSQLKSPEEFLSKVRELYAEPHVESFDVLEFKDGRLFSTYLFDKFEYKWLKYKVNKDSTYIDETETEISYFEVECTTTDDKDQTFIFTCKIDNYDIDGEMKITKNE